MIVGGVLSTTVTVKLQGVVFWLLEASVAVYVTVVVPTGKVSPGLWLEVRTTPGQLSLAVGAVQLATWLQVSRPGAVNTVVLPGQPLIVGGSLSVTVTSKLQGVLPLESLAVTVTCVTPLLKEEALPVPEPLPVVAPVKE